jgi:hypothetical protein
MAITNITNANTFGQWLSTTQSLVAVANALTDGPTFAANTVLSLTHSGETLNVANTAKFTGNVSITGSGWGLNVSNSVYVGGDLLVGGNITLDAVGFDDLSVAGNTVLSGTLSVGNTAAFAQSVIMTGSDWGLNVSNSVYVGGNLLVGGTVTLDAIGFNDLSVAGDASITGNTSITGNASISGATTLTTVNFTTAFANTGSIRVYDATVLNTATVNVLSGNAVNQFDSAGSGVAMAIALG